MIENVNHQFLNNNFLPSWEIKTLVLGTFNPEGGEVVDYFYGREFNRFWQCLAHYLGEDHNYFLNNFELKLKLMKKNNFACTDIITSIKVNIEFLPQVKGEGYSDSVLFTTKRVPKRNYQFDRIKEFLLENNVKKVLYTWGKRNNPAMFRRHVNDLIAFCELNNIEYIQPCPSPSAHGGHTIEALSRFYGPHLLE